MPGHLPEMRYRIHSINIAILQRFSRSLNYYLGTKVCLYFDEHHIIIFSMSQDRWASAGRAC